MQNSGTINSDPHQPGNAVLGPFGTGRVTVAGAEWRRWAEREGLIHCHSRFQQRQRWTWTHPRYSSEHELGHIFMSASCQWHLQKCRILFEGPSVTWPWSDYTDQNPVEIRLRHGKLWHSHRRQRKGEDKPAVRKLRVNTEEAINLRQIWESRVEEALHTFHTHSPDPTPIDKWKAICRNICRDTAVSQLAHLSVSSLPVPAQGQKRADPPTGTPNKNGPRKDSRAER